MQRRDDWRSQLTAYIVAQMRAPFAYGRNDCALFAAGAVKAMTGKDLARGFRGYRSLKEGHQKLKDKGFGDHIALVESLLPEVSVSFAQAGDIAVVNDRDGPALGVVQGEAIYVLRRDGIGLVDLLKAERAFRV